MNTSTPNSINAAVKQALRHERALNIIKEGYKFEDMGEGVIAVIKPGTTAAAYWINMITPGCDCADSMKGNTCKHELAWKIIQDEEAHEKFLIDQYEDRECATGCDYSDHHF